MSCPEEDDFFASIFPANPFTRDAEQFLEAGEMIIYDGALRSLEEQLEHLLFRATHYGEFPATKLAFCEVIEDLTSRAANIRKTSQGEG